MICSCYIRLHVSPSGSCGGGGFPSASGNLPAGFSPAPDLIRTDCVISFIGFATCGQPGLTVWGCGTIQEPAPYWGVASPIHGSSRICVPGLALSSPAFPRGVRGATGVDTRFIRVPYAGRSGGTPSPHPIRHGECFLLCCPHGSLRLPLA